MVLLDLDSGSHFIVLFTQAGGSRHTTDKKKTGSARPKYAFLSVTELHFFGQTAFSPVYIFLSGGAKRASDTGRFGSVVQGDCWFWGLPGMGYTMNGFCEEQSHLLSAAALQGLKTEQAWLEITN